MKIYYSGTFKVSRTIPCHELVGNLGSVFLGQQHALRLLNDDVLKVNKNIQDNFDSLSEKFTNPESISTQLDKMRESINKNFAECIGQTFNVPII